MGEARDPYLRLFDRAAEAESAARDARRSARLVWVATATSIISMLIALAALMGSQYR